MILPESLEGWAVVLQALASLAGLVVAATAFRAWQRQAQHQQQTVNIHNYPEAPQFTESEVETKRP